MRRAFAVAVAVSALIAASCGSGTTGNAPSPGPAGVSSASPRSAPAAATTPATPVGAALVKTTTGPLGTFLADAQGRTLYARAADTGTTSTCTGACAQAWPPMTTTTTPRASGSTTSSLLGTTRRSDGSLEVTYAGHPLYLFQGDSAAGQTNGQGSSDFGAPWWVVGTDGKAIDTTVD